MNKAEWKAKFSELRQTRSVALELDIWGEFYDEVFNSIFRGSVFHIQNDLWQDPMMDSGFTPSIIMKTNMKLPANHRGHLDARKL